MSKDYPIIKRQQITQANGIYTTSANFTGILSPADVNVQLALETIDNINADSIDDATTVNKFTNQTDITRLAYTSGINTGDQDLSPFALKTNVLELNNTTEFTPDADYEPATKKYVDDTAGFKLTSTITNSGDKISSVLIGTTTYTNTRDGYGKWSSITDGTNTWTITRTGNGKKILSIA